MNCILHLFKSNYIRQQTFIKFHCKSSRDGGGKRERIECRKIIDFAKSTNFVTRDYSLNGFITCAQLATIQFCVHIFGGEERREKNSDLDDSSMCVYDCVCRYISDLLRSNSRKTICVSAQTINNRRRRSRVPR